MVANLNDVLTPDVVSTSDFVNTEYLQTLVVIVPKNLEEQWLLEYAQIGDQIAEYGPKDSRSKTRGSPVVPGSSRKLMEEGDSVVYTVTLLKGQYQPGFLDKEGNFEPGTTVDYIEDFKVRAKEKRFVVREFDFHPMSHATTEEAIAELEVEVDRLWSALLRWCKAHFGETFIAWMHIKVHLVCVKGCYAWGITLYLSLAQIIRVFVESVLRYGLPVNFVLVMFRVRCCLVSCGVVTYLLTQTLGRLATPWQGKETALSAGKKVRTLAAGSVLWCRRRHVRLIAD